MADPGRRGVPWWALCSSAVAPVLLIGGWTLGAARRPGFDPVGQTVSALAAEGTPDRWIMTTALVGVGICHLVTAAGLRPAASGGRLVLVAGGAATILVAALPLPAHNGTSRAHLVVAGAAFVALAGWPLLSWTRTTEIWAVSRKAAVGAAVGLLGLVGWLVVELWFGERVGLAERVAAAAQACWPLVVVLAARGSARRPSGCTGP